jgi:hypothetical protein
MVRLKRNITGIKKYHTFYIEPTLKKVGFLLDCQSLKQLNNISEIASKFILKPEIVNHGNNQSSHNKKLQVYQ